jgi:prevent-host-death family protein
MEKAGIRKAKSQLSSYIKKVKQGEIIIITERGVPVARLSPIYEQATVDITSMLKEGLAVWQGGKPGSKSPYKIDKHNKTAAEMVSEDRR